MEYGTTTTDEVVKYYDMNDVQQEKLFTAFPGEKCDLFKVIDYIVAEMPEVDLPYDMVFDHQKKYYTSYRINAECLLNNLPIDIGEDYYSELSEKLKCISCAEDDRTIRIDDAISIIFEFFINGHNELVKIYGDLKKAYDCSQSLIATYSSMFSINAKHTAPTFRYESQNKDNKTNTDGYVYLAKTDTENVYKIGATRNITSREKTLRIGNVFLRIFASTPSTNMLKTEKLFHDIFKSKNIGGEWFLLDQKDIEYLTQDMGFSLFIEEKEISR